MKSNAFKFFTTSKYAIRSILQDPLRYDGWSLQGFGMLRLYLDKNIRLHIWDDRHKVDNVSLMHTHPWDFESYIVAGRIRNYRFEKDGTKGKSYFCSKIQCGPGGGMRSEPEVVLLSCAIDERYSAGEFYRQAAEEIHESYPENGTVTLVERSFKQDTEHANVYWPISNEWVSAEPRPASDHIVKTICQASLDLWFS